MNIAKLCVIASMMFSAQLSHVFAQDVASLPSIQLMADEELRDEVVTTVTPFQEDEKVQKALQHHLIKKEQDIQNSSLAQSSPALNIQPQATLPDMSNLSPLQQEFVLAVASGLQSSDPSSGIFKMLEPLGIDREKALNGVRNGGILKINIDENAMQQLFGSKWKEGVPQNLLPKN